MTGTPSAEKERTHMFKMVKKLAVEEQGADATEYALLAALIAIGIVAGASMLGESISDLFNGIGGRLATETAKV
jgi:pilus assembly protein Flp/PilA